MQDTGLTATNTGTECTAGLTVTDMKVNGRKINNKDRANNILLMAAFNLGFGKMESF